MSSTDNIADELRAVAFVLRRLGGFRHHLTGDECLRIGEALRDCADALDHGENPQRAAASPYWRRITIQLDLGRP